MPERNLFTYGRLEQRYREEQRDVSGVSSRELVTLLKEVGLPPTRKELAACSGVDGRIIYRIFGSSTTLPLQPFTALLTADRLLSGVGAEHRIHELTIIPNALLADAVTMATYEFVNCDGPREILMATPKQIEARALELMALREAMIGDEIRRLEPINTRESVYRAKLKKLRTKKPVVA